MAKQSRNLEEITVPKLNDTAEKLESFKDTLKPQQTKKKDLRVDTLLPKSNYKDPIATAYRTKPSARGKATINSPA